MVALRVHQRRAGRLRWPRSARSGAGVAARAPAHGPSDRASARRVDDSAIRRRARRAPSPSCSDGRKRCPPRTCSSCSAGRGRRACSARRRSLESMQRCLERNFLVSFVAGWFLGLFGVLSLLVPCIRAAMTATGFAWIVFSVDTGIATFGAVILKFLKVIFFSPQHIDEVFVYVSPGSRIFGVEILFDKIFAHGLLPSGSDISLTEAHRVLLHLRTLVILSLKIS